MSGTKSVVIGVHGPYSAQMTGALISVFRAAGILVESNSLVSVCVAVNEGDIAGLASGHPAKEARPFDCLTAYGASIQPLASATPSQPALDAVALAALVVGSDCHDKGSPVMIVARRVLANAGVLPSSARSVTVGEIVINAEGDKAINFPDKVWDGLAVGDTIYSAGGKANA